MIYLMQFQKALTKDYSGLMKKIDEKKNGKEGFRP